MSGGSFFSLVVVACCIAGAVGCGSSGDSAPVPGDDIGSVSADTLAGEIVVYHDASLTVPFRKVGDLFTARHPNVKIRTEVAGTRDAARTVMNLKGSWDVVGSDDYGWVERLIVPDVATHNIGFATDEMVVAYTPRSKYADEITATNWPSILLRSGVKFGRVDPGAGPSGYRALMVFELASLYFRVQTIGERLRQAGPGKVVAPMEDQLVRALRGGEIDYLPMLASQAARQRLLFVDLPPELDLGTPAHAQLYDVAKVKMDGKHPGDFITLRAKPITYSVSISKTSANADLAARFVALLLSKDGQKILTDEGLKPIAPPTTADPASLPAPLAGLCRKP